MASRSRRTSDRMFRGPMPDMLTGAQLARIDNARRPGGPQKVIGWRLIGSSYQRGRRIPGSTVLDLEDGGIVWFDERTSLAAAIARAESEHGYDVAEVRARVAAWVETGKGATFTLS